MKMDRKEVIDGKTVITTSQRFLFWYRIRMFESQGPVITGGTRCMRWLELPNKTIVPIMLTIQLDAWNGA